MKFDIPWNKQLFSSVQFNILPNIIDEVTQLKYKKYKTVDVIDRIFKIFIQL